MYHPTDLPSRDTEMAEKPVQCDRCNLTEEVAGEFFVCPLCDETLCHKHADQRPCSVVGECCGDCQDDGKYAQLRRQR